MPDRIHKLIARAGITSRRKAEVLMAEGRVTLNGEVVTEPGTKADLSADTVCVDGKTLSSRTARRYLAMHKPKGCITSTSDPEGRPTVMDLIGTELSKGLYPVGRLDYNSEGLLLLTNDGDFANHILSAKNKVPKTYEVKVTGMASESAVAKLRGGMRLDGKVARFESVQLLRIAQNPWYRVTLIQGRNRQIHRMFERIGLLVEKIRRVSIGRVSLQGLEPRQVRALRRDEIRQLLSENQPLPEELRAPPVPRGRPRRRQERRPNGRGPRRPLARRKPGGTRSRTRGGPGAGSQRDRRPRQAGGASRGPRRRGAAPDRSFRRSDRPRRSPSRPRPSGGASRGPRQRGAAPDRSFRRSDRPRQSPSRPRPSGGDPRARRGRPARAGSPRHSRAPSPARRNSRHGTRAGPRSRRTTQSRPPRRPRTTR